MTAVDPPDPGPNFILATMRRRAGHLWWISLVTGGAGFSFVWLATPHTREIATAWELVAKLFAFLCLSLAIALFPWVSPRLHWLTYVPFLFFVAYLIPRISWFYYGDGARAHGDSFYTHLYLLLYPGIVLTAAASYRIGGGSPGRTLKIMYTGIVIVFSGLLDLMWWVVNPVDLPATIDAPHINLFTGGPISYSATILFTLAHLPVVIGINLLPLDRWIAGLLATDDVRALPRS